MNRVLFICILVLLSHEATGVLLKELVDENVRNAARAEQQSTVNARLWIIVKSHGQDKLADEILDRISKAEFRSWKIEKMPIQLAQSGSIVPRRTQLRYFKRRDQTQAKELFDVLRKFIPDLELLDASRKYEKIDWIKSGHFELWLSPKLTDLRLQ